MTRSPEAKRSAQEGIKEESDGLRGAIPEELADRNAFVSDASYELLKFHGSYQGYNRDTATVRKKQGLDKEWEFMVRIKMPAGRLTAEQYLALDRLAGDYANGTLRITTRETIQFHCIVKGDLKPIIAGINHTLLSTLGGCGDVVRNVTCCPAPVKGKIHDIFEQAAFTLAKHMAPRTKQYHEIWLDGEKIDTSGPAQVAPEDEEPLYGATYLPRKFKIGLARPEDNCIDVLTNDLAFIALFDGEELQGYNVALGGGMGMKHNKPETYPRLATPVVFIAPEDLVPVAEAVVKLQRDHGDRSNRQHARLKYVVEEKGIAWTKQTLEEYAGKKLEGPRPMPAFTIHDHMGWHAQGDGKWYLGLPVTCGRIKDYDNEYVRSAVREVVRKYRMDLRLTAESHLIFCDIEEGQKEDIVQILRKHKVVLREDITEAYRYALACVALPTCGKALAEAERVKVPLMHDIEKVMEGHGLKNEKIAIRMAGCPNGCSRPYVGDIGIVGRAPGLYALFVGGDFEGTRLNEKILDKVKFNDIPQVADHMFALFAQQRRADEPFGDFCQRVGVEVVKQAVLDGMEGKVS